MNLHLSPLLASLSNPPTFIQLPPLTLRTFTSSSRTPQPLSTHTLPVSSSANLLSVAPPYIALVHTRKSRHHLILVHLHPAPHVIFKAPLPDRPVCATILRGPSVIALLSTNAVVSVRNNACTQLLPSASQRLLSPSESGLEAAVLDVTASSATFHTICHTGDLQSFPSFPITHPVTSVVISFRRRLIILHNSKQSSFHFYDILGTPLWQLAYPNDQTLFSFNLYQNSILAVSKQSQDIHHLHIASDAAPTLLFSSSCTSSSSSHEHFYLPWRDKLLQCNSQTGTICAQTTLPNSQLFIPPISHSPLTAVATKLQHRLHLGVQRLTSLARRQEHKQHMLTHVQTLLQRECGTDSFPPALFTDLHNFVQLPEKRQAVAQLIKDGDKPGDTNVARVLQAEGGVDSTGRFIVISVQTTPVEDAATSLALRVHFDKPVAAVWDVESAENITAGEVVRLQACAPLSAVVMQGAGALNLLNILVFVQVGHSSQHVGTFPLADMLCNVRPDVMSRDGLLSFQRTVYGVAQGPNANKLQEAQVAENFQVSTREQLACFSFKVASATELALAVAKMRSSLDDDIQLRASSSRTVTCLGHADVALKALDAEMKAVRDIGARRTSVGYDRANVAELLRLQMSVDEAFGQLEEQYLGT